jgi:hypothetical protein
MSTQPRLYMEVLPLSNTHRFVARRRLHGFTLLDLMSAVALAILLATVAVPTYRNIVEGQKSQQAANDLTALYDRLLSYWVILSDTSYRDLARAFASRVIALFRRVLPTHFWSLRGLTFWTAVSWLLTTGAAIAVEFFEPGMSRSNPHDLFLPQPEIYLATWVFDLATFFLTLRVLIVVRDRGALVSVAAIPSEHRGGLYALCGLFDEQPMDRRPRHRHAASVHSGPATDQRASVCR